MGMIVFSFFPGAMLWSALVFFSTVCEYRGSNLLRLRAIAPICGVSRLQENMSHIFQIYLPVRPVKGIFMAGRLLAYAIAWNRPRFASQHRASAGESLDAEIEMKRLAANTWHVRYIALYRESGSVGTCAE
jgi:hypothetical protein